MIYLFLVLWLLFYFVGMRIENARVRAGLWPDRGDRMSTTGLVGTLLHAVIMSIWGPIVLVQEFNIGQTNTPAQNLILHFSLAWFIVDTLWIFVERFFRFDLIFHHLICMLGLIWVLYANKNGWEMTAGDCFGEMAPCFYVGILAKRWKFGSERFHFINDTAYVISFTLTRFIVYSILAYLVISGDEAHLILKTSAIGLLLLSYYWGVLLVRKYLDKWGNML